MASRWTVTQMSDIGGIREFRVHKGTVPVYMANRVWVSADNVPRCVSCSGPLTAMLASCAHALAVKRAMKSGNVVVRKEDAG